MHYTVQSHCTIRDRAQSVRRQHRERTSEKSDMVTYMNKPLGRMGHNMLKLTVIFLLNSLPL